MKSWLKVVLVNCFVVFVLLIIIDPFLKNNDTKSDIKVERSLHMREYGANRTIYLNPYGHVPDTSKLDRDNYVIQTDDFGFICGPDEDKSSFPSIIFYGGSTVECAFVDDSLRYPYLTGKSIGVSTRNSGYGGNHSFHSFINFIGNGLRYKPKMVIWMHNINDLTLLSKTGSYFVSPSNRRIVNQNEINYHPPLKERLNSFKLSLINITIPNLYKRLSRFKRKESQKNQDEWSGYRNLKSDNFQEILELYEASQQSFIDIARVNNIQVVLMTQFNRLNVNDQEVRDYYFSKDQSLSYEDYSKLYSSFNDKIRELATKNNLVLIDLDNAFKSKPNMFYDAVHLNNAGSVYAASVIAPILDSVVAK